MQGLLGSPRRTHRFTFLAESTYLDLVQAADWGPGVYPDRGREFLEAEPGAGLIGAYLEGYSFSQDIDGKFQIFHRWRA